MQKAVKRFVEKCIANANEQSNGDPKKSKPHGLTLIDMPTGSGKTYNTIQMIASYLRGEIFQDVPKIFYLTPLNKNVKDAYDQLKKVLEEKEGGKDLFKNNCLWLKANFQAVVENISKVESAIPKELKKDSFYDLRKGIQGYLTFNQGNNNDIAGAKQIFENDIREKYEPFFRHEIKNALAKLCHSKKEKEKKVLSDWKWLIDLYPSILTERRRVLFMSVDKFFMLNDPIISKPYSFINSNILRGALVFIDEFDASKEFILRSQIRQSAKKKLDLVKYMSTLSSTFASDKKFPSELFPKPKDGEEKKSSRYAFDRLKAVVNDCREKNHLDYHFKLENPDQEKRCFIFQDDDLHTVSNTKDTPTFSLATDEKKSLNLIRLEKDDKGNSKAFFQLIYSLTGALSFSSMTFSMMARNYLNYYNYEKRKSKTNDDMMSPEEAVSTILGPFELDTQIQSVIANIVNSGFNSSLKIKKNRILGGNIYTDGFRYLDFEDDLSHDTTTTIDMCTLSDTPERFMLSLCSTAMVVGISATATIETVTGNYNLNFLKKYLGKNYIPLSEEDNSRVSTRINERYRQGRDYKVNVTAIEPKSAKNSEDEEYSKEIFDKPDDIELLSAKLSTFNNHDYEKRRYLRVLAALKDFLCNPNSKALLVLTNNNVKPNGDHPFSQEVLRLLVERMEKELGLNQKAAIHFLHGNIFEKEKEEYQKDLKDKKRVILFTSYPSSGTGQNLQYSIMEGEDESSSMEKDIDSIYLEKPTNILVNINLDYDNPEAFLSEEDLIKYIYQTESLGYEGEVDHLKALNMIKRAFKIYMKGERQTTCRTGVNEYGTKSVNNHILRTLEQAVGRICRTRDPKKDDVNIYVAKDIFDQVSFKPVEGKLMNKEFKAIVDQSTKAWDANEIHSKANLVQAVNRSNSLARNINSLLEKNREKWSQEDMKEWRDIREWILKHPTCSRADLEGHEEYSALYLEVPNGLEHVSSIYFSTKKENKEEISEIQFVSSGKSYKEISDNECNLKRLMKIPEVSRYFSRHEYAQTFAKNEMILLPTAYINLYKGALGEAVGYAILTTCGIHLKEIDEEDKFEKFDFALSDAPDVYIDFKLWSIDSEEAGERLIQKTEEKLKRVNGKKAFVINIVSENTKLRIHDNGRICRVPNIVEYRGNCLYIDREKREELFKKINVVKDN